MFPRRSRVLRCAIAASACFSLFLIYSSDYNNNNNPLPRRILDPALLEGNETVLRRVIIDLQETLIRDGLLRLPAEPASNSSTTELRQYILSLNALSPVNPHSFNVLINPNKVCEGLDIYMLVYVHSAPSHLKQRNSVREMWGNSKNFPDRVIRVIFLCGVTPEEKSVQEALMLEADTFGDILQVDFVDSYRNLTYKAISGLRWISQNCMNARYILKSDDDIFINIFNMVDRIDSKNKEPVHLLNIVGRIYFKNYEPMVKKFLMCLVWSRMKVVRERQSKWYLSRAEFADDYFPQYCSGSAFVMSPDVAAGMYDASLRTPFFWVDDFYVTGLLARDVGVQRYPYNEFYALGPSVFFKRFSEPNATKKLTVGHVHNLKQMQRIWDMVLRERRPKFFTPANTIR